MSKIRTKNPAIVDFVSKLSTRTLPKQHFRVSYSRSSGPGGQKVNKTSSKATIQLDNLYSQSWIPIELRNLLTSSNFRYLTKSTNSVVIQSDVSRSREQNTDLCFDKFVSELKNAVQVVGEVSEEDKLKWQQLEKKAAERKLESKLRHSQKKQSRRVKHEY